MLEEKQNFKEKEVLKYPKQMEKNLDSLDCGNEEEMSLENADMKPDTTVYLDVDIVLSTEEED